MKHGGTTKPGRFGRASFKRNQRNKTMSKFNTIADLIEAAAQQSHVANLHVGGIFSEDGSRHSDIEAERRVAAQRGTQFVHANYAHLEGFAAGQSVRYIPHVGYVNA